MRIEDIDPPREQRGAADDILRTLEAYGLHWDADVLYQSTRTSVYRDIAHDLVNRGHAFRCSCSRKDVQSASALAASQVTDTPGGNHVDARRYPGTCRTRVRHEGSTAIRMRVDEQIVRFDDGLQGPVEIDLAATEGDYLIYRRDGLPAYHLAVVVDDAHQGVTSVVRGADLLTATGVHRHLQRQLRIASPRYWHVPVLVDAHGAKLSKQTGAAPVGIGYSPATAMDVLRLLGLQPPQTLANSGSQALWEWAIAHWRMAELIGRSRIHSQ